MKVVIFKGQYDAGLGFQQRKPPRGRKIWKKHSADHCSPGTGGETSSLFYDTFTWERGRCCGFERTELLMVARTYQNYNPIQIAK